MKINRPSLNMSVSFLLLYIRFLMESLLDLLFPITELRSEEGQSSPFHREMSRQQHHHEWHAIVVKKRKLPSPTEVVVVVFCSHAI